MNFQLELVWTDDSKQEAASIFLTGDGRVVLQGRTLTAEERARLGLPEDTGLISVDRALIQAIKEML